VRARREVDELDLERGAARLSVRSHEVDVLWGRVGGVYPRLGLRLSERKELLLSFTWAR